MPTNKRVALNYLFLVKILTGYSTDNLPRLSFYL